MIKFIFLLLLFLGVSYIGIAISLNYSKKERFYGELIMFCNVLGNNIRFSKNKLKTIIGENLSNFKTELNEYLKCYLENGEYNVAVLNELENRKLNEFFLSLGKMDASGELNNIENYKEIFNRFYETSKLNNGKFGSLSSKLGILFGLILVIMFI